MRYATQQKHGQNALNSIGSTNGMNSVNSSAANSPAMMNTLSPMSLQQQQQQQMQQQAGSSSLNSPLLNSMQQIGFEYNANGLELAGFCSPSGECRIDLSILSLVLIYTYLSKANQQVVIVAIPAAIKRLPPLPLDLLLAWAPSMATWCHRCHNNSSNKTSINTSHHQVSTRQVAWHLNTSPKHWTVIRHHLPNHRVTGPPQVRIPHRTGPRCNRPPITFMSPVDTKPIRDPKPSTYKKKIIEGNIFVAGSFCNFLYLYIYVY